MQMKQSFVLGARTEMLVFHVSPLASLASCASKTLINSEKTAELLYMSNFLQMLPRRLPVALADYIAVTAKDEFQRRAIAKRIYTTLSNDQQTEMSRICETMSASGQETGIRPRGDTVAAAFRAGELVETRTGTATP